MERQRIILLSYGHFEREFINKIAGVVTREFNRPVDSDVLYIDLNPFYNPSRRQYNANELLKYIDTVSLPAPAKTIGLFSVDLFIPILTYIFGQAGLNGCTAIASSYRLRNELYGLKRNDHLLLDRFMKEVVHELGHTFGLIHCHVHTCVMRSSTYAEDIDQKSVYLCSGCREKIASVL